MISIKKKNNQQEIEYVNDNFDLANPNNTNNNIDQNNPVKIAIVDYFKGR